MQARDIQVTNTNIFWGDIELVRHIIVQIIGIRCQVSSQISDWVLLVAAKRQGKRFIGSMAEW